MKRFIKSIASFGVAASILFANMTAIPAAFAAGTGQIGGGTNMYLVKNLTKGGDYADSVSASCNDELQYSILLHNSGFTTVNNVNVKATLPSVASTTSTSSVTATYTDGVVPSTSDTTSVTFATPQVVTYDGGATVYNGSGGVINANPGDVTAGVNIGSIDGSTDVYLNFKGKVNCNVVQPPAYSCDLLSVSAEDNRVAKIDDFKTSASNGAAFSNAVINWGDGTSTTSTSPIGKIHNYTKDGTYTIVATAHFTINGSGDVTNTGPDCTDSVTITTHNDTPVYSCDKLSLSATEDRKATITDFATTAKNGATFKNAVIDWGDNSTNLTTDNVKGQTHTYAKDGTYVVTATAHFTVDGKDVSATSASCAQQITFKSGTPPTITPPTTTPGGPTTLVNTGAGSVMGMFAAATVIGAFVHRRMLSRRLVDSIEL